MHTEVFADGIGEITVTGHTVRIDLVSLSPGERNASGQPISAFRQRIVMPLEGFTSAHELICRVVEGMKSAGPPAKPAATPAMVLPIKATDSSRQQPASGVGSPNFD